MNSFTLTSNVALINARMRRKAGDAAFETASWIQEHIVGLMAEEKHGRDYRIGGVIHTASAPYESPAVETSNLSNSIQAERAGETAAIVGTNVEYAEILEFGGISLMPRPFMAPAFTDAKPVFNELMREVANV